MTSTILYCFKCSGSGSEPGLAHIPTGKEGNREVKSILLLACLGCINPRTGDNDFRDYYMRLIGRGMVKMKAVAATMGKMAEIIYCCQVKGTLTATPVSTGEVPCSLCAYRYIKHKRYYKNTDGAYRL